VIIFFQNPSTNFGQNMEKIIKKCIVKISDDAGPNRAELFARASLAAFLAKLVRGHDFYNRFAH